MQKETIVLQLVAIKLASETEVNQTFISKLLDLVRGHGGIVHGMIDGGECCTWRRADDPERALLFDQPHCPATILGSSKVPVESIRPGRSEVEHLKPLAVEPAAPAGSTGQATLAIQLKESGLLGLIARWLDNGTNISLCLN